jgi:drug/metabolite transporter (DMT)-like permease
MAVIRIMQAVLLSSSGWGALRPSAQVLIASLPLVSVALLAVLTFFFLLWDYRHKRLVVERGGTPVPRKLDEKLLLIGIVALFVGAGLLVYFALKTGLSDALLGGIIPTTAGLGIITYYAFVQRRKAKS